MQKMNVIA